MQRDRQKNEPLRMASFFFAQQSKGLLMIGGMWIAFALFAYIILAVAILLIVAKIPLLEILGRGVVGNFMKMNASKR